jgi:hypothetical protein
MKYYSESITNLIEELASLPNIGPKSAQRLALHILNLPEARVKHLADSILTAKQKICFCKECFNLSDQELCQVCADEKRDHQTIMVVEEPSDLAAYEKTGQYKGVYHVLHGAISPMLGVGPGDIKLKELSLGYSFPQKMLRRTPLTQLKLSFVARNLCFLMKHTPGNPDGGYDTTMFSQAIDYMAVPYTRTFGFSVNVGF